MFAEAFRERRGHINSLLALRLRTVVVVMNARAAEIIAPQAAKCTAKLMRFASVSNASANDAGEMTGKVAARQATQNANRPTATPPTIPVRIAAAHRESTDAVSPVFMSSLTP
jgi:hypothetical protein